jgi:transcription elongation factor GreB
MDSPMAKAMLGKQIDDEFTVATPSGDQLFDIIAINYHFLND